MSALRIGSLFSGYGGLEMGVAAALAEQGVSAEPAWFVEYDEAPSRILAHHWPTVPNHGDITTLDFHAVTPVQIVTAGYPCQPFSLSGNRKGADDARHLWPYVLLAIRVLRPEFVVLENVRGHLTLGFGRVIGDLADAGYDAQWACLPASAAGAPHRRERVFIVAHPTCEPGCVSDGDDVPVRSGTLGRASTAGRGLAAVTTDIGIERSRRARGWRAGSPDSSDAAADASSARLREQPGGASAEEAGAHEGDQPADHRGQRPDTDWGPYRAAIDRWASVTGRSAPAAALHGRLDPRFVEWMMGLGDGHVTGVGISRTAQLRALGNGVVPQQATLAVRTLLPHLPAHALARLGMERAA